MGESENDGDKKCTNFRFINVHTFQYILENLTIFFCILVTPPNDTYSLFFVQENMQDVDSKETALHYKNSYNSAKLKGLGKSYLEYRCTYKYNRHCTQQYPMYKYNV